MSYEDLIRRAEVSSDIMVKTFLASVRRKSAELTQKQNENFVAAISTEREKLRVVQGELQKITENNNSVRKRRDELVSENRNLDEEIDSINRLIVDYNQKIAAYSDECDRARERLQQLKNLTEKREKLQLEKTAEAGKLQDLNAELERKQPELTAAAEKIKQLKPVVELMEKIQNQLQEIWNSASVRKDVFDGQSERRI